MARQKEAKNKPDQQSETAEPTTGSAAKQTTAVNEDSQANGSIAPDSAAKNGRASQPEDDAESPQVVELRQQLAAAQAKADEYLDRLQRTAAEYQNSKKRQEKQLTESIERASLHLIRRLLPVLDDLDLAFRNMPEELSAEESAWVTGFAQIQKKLRDLLSDEGVSQIPTDGVFDPNRHEAISGEPSDGVESGHVIETLRIGYEHKGTVLRPALVRVAA